MSAVQWSRISPWGDRSCTTEGCLSSARWHMVAGDIGSDYCNDCRGLIDEEETEERVAVLEAALRRAAEWGVSSKNHDGGMARDLRPAWGTRGREFKSRRSDQSNQSLNRWRRQVIRVCFAVVLQFALQLNRLSPISARRHRPSASD